MSIGKIIQRRWDCEGPVIIDKDGKSQCSDKTRYQIVSIVLLPTFQADKYETVSEGKRYSNVLGSGASLYSESGSQLEVVSSPGYPNLSAKSLEANVVVYGKITNDNKEATEWIKAVGLRLLPSKLFTSAKKWNETWAPLESQLREATTAGRATEILSKIRSISDKKDEEMVSVVTSSGPGGPGTFESGDKVQPIVDSASKDDSSHKVEMKIISTAGKNAVKDAGNVLKNEASAWWDEIGIGTKIAVFAAGVVAIVGTAMAISEKVD